jgi:isoamylase
MDELAARIMGSPDLFDHRGRRPWASVNFIASHDGFTLADVVSYDVKHNEANGEGNRDGANENYSWNCGAEGPTTASEILGLRRRQQRNMLASLVLSQGTPMLQAGDEFGRSQEGNNNAYCQDNELGWIDWSRADTVENAALRNFVQRLIHLRLEHNVFHRSRFSIGEPATPKEIRWFRPNGQERTSEDRQVPNPRCLGFLLSAATHPSQDGAPLGDDAFFVILNADDDDIPFTLPLPSMGRWQCMIDTSNAGPFSAADPEEDSSTYQVKPRSLVLLHARGDAADE